MSDKTISEVFELLVNDTSEVSLLEEVALRLASEIKLRQKWESKTPKQLHARLSEIKFDLTRLEEVSSRSRLAKEHIVELQAEAYFLAYEIMRRERKKGEEKQTFNPYDRNRDMNIVN